MSYAEYTRKLMQYNNEMSYIKSLRMQIRMNKVHLTGDNLRSKKRLLKIAECKEILKNLPVPQKPQKQYGFDICTDNDTYFAPTTNEDDARFWAENELDCKFCIWPSKRQITTDYKGLIW